MHVCCFGGADSSFWHLFDTSISSKNSQKIWVTLPSFPYRKSVANIFHTSSITKVGYRYLLKIDIQVWNLKVDFLNSAVTAPQQCADNNCCCGCCPHTTQFPQKWPHPHSVRTSKCTVQMPKRFLKKFKKKNFFVG